MRHPSGSDPNTSIDTALADYARARARRVAAEAIEADCLQRVLLDTPAGLSLRDIERLTHIPRATLGRKRLEERADVRHSAPPQHYDEDEWVAAADAASGGDAAGSPDRGPWRATHEDDGSVRFTALAAGAVGVEVASVRFVEPRSGDEVRAGALAAVSGDVRRPDPGVEPLQGITDGEFAWMVEHMDEAGAQRILRRLARAVLRVQHPGVARLGVVLDAAMAGVRRDPVGAMVLAGLAVPTASASAEWVAGLRARAREGFYLPAVGGAGAELEGGRA